VALEALRGDKMVQEIAAKRQLHPTQVSTWKRQAIEGMAGVFSDKIKKVETPKLMHEIDRVFTKHPFFGSRQIAAYFPRSGFSAGRHRVRRLMSIMGLQANYKGPNTRKKHLQHRIYPYLLRKLAIIRPNQVWCSDITYIPVKNGFLYMVPIMAWTPRKVLTWRLSSTGDASFCVEALEEAISKYGKPEIMNTDQGSQYAGSGWITTLTETKIKISMGGRGRYLDNIFIERLWRSLKQEAVYLREITDGFQAKRIIDDWIGIYNSERLTPPLISARQTQHTSTKRKH
jgi:putative transposase